jgi:hypothetical protein
MMKLPVCSSRGLAVAGTVGLQSPRGEAWDTVAFRM